MLQFLQWTILRMLLVKGVFSLYLSIPGLRKGPGKFITGVLEKSWIFSSERVGTLYVCDEILRRERHSSVN